MTRMVPLIGALLAAALLFAQMPPGADPQLGAGEPRWFLLSESKDQVTRALGVPVMVADFGQDFQSWQYQIDTADHDAFSHVVVFRKSDLSLVSVTRTYDPERNVDALFPEPETAVYHYPNERSPQYSLRLRRLSGGRVLMAMGAPKRGQATGQLVLMRESEVRNFYPWLHEQLYAGKRSAR